MRSEIEKKIAENLNPLKINLTELEIHDEELVELISALKSWTDTVSTIDLDNNNIADEGAILLGRELRNFKHLKEISLQYNNIGRTGAIELFRLKTYYPDLDILFHGNKIIDVDEMDEIEHLARGKR